MKITLMQGNKPDMNGNIFNDLRTILETQGEEPTTINDSLIHLHTYACNEIRKNGNCELLKKAVNRMFNDVEEGIEWAKEENFIHWNTWYSRSKLLESSYPAAFKTIKTLQKSRKEFKNVEELKDIIAKKKE